MSLFENIPSAAPDPILGLTDAFSADQRPHKINLGVGVYKDEGGATPILKAVKEAETLLLSQESSKSYLPISGAPAYAAAVQELLFGIDSEVIPARRAVTLHTPGGTGALRIAADFIATHFPQARIWVSEPTWPNHAGIFSTAKVAQVNYPYFDSETNGLNFAGMLEALRSMQPGDICLLHGCCHNPTGVDPSPEQWRTIAEILKQRDCLALIDFAYQGFAVGIEEDTEAVRACLNAGLSFMVASSFSKNFGLYNERVGALTIVTADSQEAARVGSQFNLCVRTNYSNPPCHGAAIVTTVWNDPQLRQEWLNELNEMRDRIRLMRNLLVEKLGARNIQRTVSFIAEQQGMFSFSGLKPDEVAALKNDFAIYIVGSGRINVAGITLKNIDYLCDCIAAVIAS